jgi:hypothetical protein
MSSIEDAEELTTKLLSLDEREISPSYLIPYKVFMLTQYSAVLI